MLLRKMNEIPTFREMIDVFKGYNHNLRIGNGEFYDMKNLTSDFYPLLAPRRQRGVYFSIGENDSTGENGDSTGEIGAIVAKEALCFLVGTKLHIRKNENEDVSIDLAKNLSGTEPKWLVPFGTYVLIFPDALCVNLKPGKESYEVEHINAEVFSPIGTNGYAEFHLCHSDGGEFSDYPAYGQSLPLQAEDKEYFIEEIDTGYILKQYSSETRSWNEIKDTYIKIYIYDSINIGKDWSQAFNVGDGIEISGVPSNDTKQDSLNGKHTILLKGKEKAGEDDKYYIVISGNGKAFPKYNVTSTITLKREMPKLDFVFECENRLWGCRYGEANNGEFVNEIYASKLGDFRNWNCFEGISTDSYAVSVGTEGKFTGAIAHLGYPLFFKENCIHKIYGNYPATYQVQTTPCRGVQEGCAKSLAIVNETLFFKSRNSVCVYDGSLPVEISSALGDMSYSNAVAGALGNKYYISMMGAPEEYHLFVFDALKGLWHREDSTRITDFCNYLGELYFVDHGNRQIHSVNGSGTLDDSPVEWEAETGIIGTDMPDKKYISRIEIRLLLSAGASVAIYAEYDSLGEWELLHSMDGANLKSFPIPIRPKRCDHLRLKLIGKGDAKIFSICKTIEQGSEA